MVKSEYRMEVCMDMYSGVGIHVCDEGLIGRTRIRNEKFSKGEMSKNKFLLFAHSNSFLSNDERWSKSPSNTLQVHQIRKVKWARRLTMTFERFRQVH